MTAWFGTDPDIGLIDLGANIGAYTLPIAAMGHRVVAVEPHLDSVRRLHKAVVLGDLQNRINTSGQRGQQSKTSYQALQTQEQPGSSQWRK